MNNRKNILFVDDDFSIQKFVSTILEKKGYSVSKAENGEKALELIKKIKFDVGIFDMKLPDMDGTEILEKIKGNTMIKIVLTGFPSLDNAILTTRYGADSYLVKPINPKILISTINEQYRIRTEKNQRQQILFMDALVNFINLLDSKKSSLSLKDIADDLNSSIETVETITLFYEKIGAVTRNNGNVEANKETNIWELLIKLPSEQVPIDKQFISRL